MLRSLKEKFNNMDKILLFLTLAFSIFGLFNIVSASSREAVVKLDQNVYYYFYRHLIILVLGYIAFFLIIQIDTKKYYRWIPLIFLLLVGLNVYVIINGKITRGAINWIDLGFFNLQPSELAKPVLIAALALFLEKWGKRLRNPRVKHGNLIGMFCIIGLIFPAIVFFQKDLGTATILSLIFGVAYLLSPILSKEKWKVVGVLACMLVFAALFLYAKQGEILTEKQRARLDFFNPCSHFNGNGYQVCNAFVAINLGGLKGVGINQSTQKYSYIPEAHTDMVFAIFAEEYGYLWGMLALILYAVIIFRILMLASSASTIRGKYICLGVGTYLFAHVFINLGGLFGMIPLTGVPLPFLTYGGSFTISLLVALAMVQAVHIETKSKVRF